MSGAVLSDLLDYTRDGEWGEGEPSLGLVPVQVIRGTDFERVRYGDLSTLPVRYLRSDLTERKRLVLGDVLIETAGGTKDQPTGRTVLVGESVMDRALHPLVCASFARFLRPKREAVDPAYLFWKLQSEYRSGAMLPYHVQHTGVARFQYTQFAASHVLDLPNDLGLQREVATTLTALDDKIELNRRTNETLEAMAQAIFRDWFVDFGPSHRKRGGATDPVAVMGGVTQDAGRTAELAALFPHVLGDDGVPLGWSEEPVFDQALWVNGAAYKKMHFVAPGEGLPVIKIAELKAGVTPTTAFTNSDLGDRYRIDDGELMFSWSGNPDTSIDAFIWTGGPAWLNQHIFAVRENGSRTLGFLFAMLKYLKPTFAEIARDKQTTGLGHVTKEDLKRLRVVRPAKDVEAAFNALMTPIFLRLKAAQIENRALAEARDYLLPRLMSGTVRVVSSSAAPETTDGRSA